MKTAICVFATATVYLAAWVVGINAGGIYPIGSQASYVAGGVCTINLEKDSDERLLPYRHAPSCTNLPTRKHSQ